MDAERMTLIEAARLLRHTFSLAAAAGDGRGCP